MLTDAQSNRLPVTRSPLVISTSGAAAKPVVVTPPAPVCPLTGRTRSNPDIVQSTQNGPDGHANENNRKPIKWICDRNIFKNVSRPCFSSIYHKLPHL